MPPPIELTALRLSVAPMMDWTDTFCRVFHRLLAPSASRIDVWSRTPGDLQTGAVVHHTVCDFADPGADLLPVEFAPVSSVTSA